MKSAITALITASCLTACATTAIKPHALVCPDVVAYTPDQYDTALTELTDHGHNIPQIIEFLKDNLTLRDQSRVCHNILK